MKIISIEPTPSPNTMKINLDTELAIGKRNNYKKETSSGAPKVIGEILKIGGVKGVYHVADFLAVERDARFPWPEILSQVRRAFGEENEEQHVKGAHSIEHYGEIKVQVQMFKGIPLQVKLTDSSEERRFGMPELYTNAVSQAQKPDENYILERRWDDQGIRYGDFDKVGKEVIEELIAAYPEERIKNLLEKVRNADVEEKLEHRKRLQLVPEDLDHYDWQKRYQLLEQMADPTINDLPLLDKALSDEKASIRRLATVYLGMIEDRKVLPYLYKALKDKSVAVRRTAGDCMSDLGFPEATDAMTEALKDKNKLVRWRAAMFLFETGTDKALPALQEAEHDPEFEVSMQIKLAIERIELGTEAKGSVWKQMLDARKKN